MRGGYTTYEYDGWPATCDHMACRINFSKDYVRNFLSCMRTRLRRYVEV